MLNRNEVIGIVRSVITPPSNVVVDFLFMQQEKDLTVLSWSRVSYEQFASKKMVGILITIWVKSKSEGKLYFSMSNAPQRERSVPF